MFLIIYKFEYLSNIRNTFVKALFWPAWRGGVARNVSLALAGYVQSATKSVAIADGRRCFLAITSDRAIVFTSPLR